MRVPRMHGSGQRTPLPPHEPDDDGFSGEAELDKPERYRVMSGAGGAMRVKELRDKDRRLGSFPVVVHEIDPNGPPGAAVNAETIDLSPTGLSVRCRRMIHVGRQVVVLFEGGGGRPGAGVGSRGHATCVFAQSVYARYLDAGMHQVGLKIVPRPMNAGLERWLRERKVA